MRGHGATLAVTVIDTLGRFVSGAAVTSPSGSAPAPMPAVCASLAVATGSEQVLSIAKDGFAEQVKSDHGAQRPQRRRVCR